MTPTLGILVALLAATAVAAALRDPALPLRGLEATGRLLRGVWLELAIGFLLAGMLEVLVPAPALARWLGEAGLGRGILIGWAAGLLLPGGPYVFFPVAAGLYRSGAAPGPLIALLTAKTLVSPVRTLTYEAPLLGWPLTLARFLPGVLLPPLMGWLGQWLYGLLRR
ncbi:MAG TPA: permease [Calidithermus sp.]|nr:permease [Calidithermus sp.]